MRKLGTWGGSGGLREQLIIFQRRKSLSLGMDLKHKRGRVTHTAGMTTPLASGVMRKHACVCVCVDFFYLYQSNMARSTHAPSNILEKLRNTLSSRRNQLNLNRFLRAHEQTKSRFGSANAHLTRIVNSDSIIPSPAQVTPLNEDPEDRVRRPEEAGFTQPPLKKDSAFVFAVTRWYCAPLRRAFCLPFLPSETMRSHNVPQSWN